MGLAEIQGQGLDRNCSERQMPLDAAIDIDLIVASFCVSSID